MTESEYNQYLRPYARALRQILLDLDFFLEDVGSINVYSITSRLKSYSSAMKKSRKKNIEISDLQDLAGIRIVIATQHEIDVIVRFFTRKEYSNALKVESDKKIAKDDGYKARHVVVLIRAGSIYPARIEVQLQTIFEHAYNFISRAWVYKSERSFSKSWKSKFQDLSEKLGTLDYIATELHNDVIESASNEGDTEPLSPLSYQRIVKSVFQEVIALEDAVDACRFLVDIGCNTNGKLKAFFNNPEVHRLRERFCALRSTNGVAISQHIQDWPLNAFWIVFGCRLEATKKFLKHLED